MSGSAPKARATRRVRPGLLVWMLAALAQSALALVVMVTFVLTFADQPSPFSLYSMSVREVVDEIRGLLREPEFWLYFGLWMGGILVAQTLLLLPVRRPTPRREHGVSLVGSLVTAALAMALLAAGAILALLELMGAWMPMLEETEWGGWALLAVPMCAWIVFTPLLILFARGKRRESALTRLASGLFLGSMVEAIAVIPLDVMIRRRTDCYCAESTFFTLVICGTVGIFAFGPALFLVLLSRRRKRWWEGKCDWCGYDMSGSLHADRCPECGAGWRA